MSDIHEYEVQNDGEMLAAGGNGYPPLDPPVQYGYEGDDLDGAALEEDEAYAAPAAAAADGGATVTDADFARLEARAQLLEEHMREREAARIHPKVVAGTAASAVGATAAMVLPLLDGLDLPDGLEQVIGVVIVLIITFVGGYLKSGRPAAPSLGG